MASTAEHWKILKTLKNANKPMKKKEQFNLALWDRLKKDNIPHSFETRGGTPVTQITEFEVAFRHRIAGVYSNDIQNWDINGAYFSDVPTIESASDLFIVWEEEQLMLEGWLNVYGFETNYFNNIPKTREIADSNAMEGRIACVKVSIPYIKGEGLENGK